MVKNILKHHYIISTPDNSKIMHNGKHLVFTQNDIYSEIEFDRESKFVLLFNQAIDPIYLEPTLIGYIEHYGALIWDGIDAVLFNSLGKCFLNQRTNRIIIKNKTNYIIWVSTLTPFCNFDQNNYNKILVPMPGNLDINFGEMVFEIQDIMANMWFTSKQINEFSRLAFNYNQPQFH